MRLAFAALCVFCVLLVPRAKAGSQSSFAPSLFQPRVSQSGDRTIVTFALQGDLQGSLTLSLARPDPTKPDVTGDWSAATYTPPVSTLPPDQQVGDEPGEVFDPGPPSLSGTLAGSVSGGTLVLDAAGGVTGLNAAQLQIVSGSLSFASVAGAASVSATGIDGAAGVGSLQLTLTSSSTP